jgi:CHASE3 domain sensor protein
MKLKLKLTLGFIIIAIMLFIAGAWSVIQVKFAGSNLRQTFDENLEMIYEINNLNRALENEQKAFMLFLIDKKDESKKLLSASDSIFVSSFKKINSKIQSKKEKQIISDIKSNYQEIKDLTTLLLASNPEESKEIYFIKLKEIVDKFDKVIDEFQGYYEKRLGELTERINTEENRSITPGLVAMSAAIIFTLLFSFFVNHYVVTPIITITKKVNDYTERGIPYDYVLETEDEIFDLSESVRRLTTKAEINRD